MNVSGYAYRRCRLLSHAWDEVDSLHWNVNPRWKTIGVPMTLRCQHCDMERRDTIDKTTAEVIARVYIQPTGYHWNQEEKPKRIDFRLAWLDDHIAEMRAERQKRRGVAP